MLSLKCVLEIIKWRYPEDSGVYHARSSGEMDTWAEGKGVEVMSVYIICSGGRIDRT